MASTFKAVAEALGISCIGIPARLPDGPVPFPVGIVRDIHSQWFAKGRYEPGDRFLHVIRDPRDIVISSMHYHRTSGEKWLHRPDELFGGQTYQQALNSLPDDKERLIFEMNHASGKTINEMCSWPYGRGDCFETKYETLLNNGDEEFGKAARHLGLRGKEIDFAVSAFLKNSLADGARHKITSGIHIRSGAAEQWRTVYDRELKQAFTDRFPGALSLLGYEPFSVDSTLPPDQR